jgi:hypothetical protein
VIDDETEQRARRLTELEERYARARSQDFGPLSKEIAEERDAIMARIAHPESKE